MKNFLGAMGFVLLVSQADALCNLEWVCFDQDCQLIQVCGQMQEVKEISPIDTLNQQIYGEECVIVEWYNNKQWVTSEVCQ